MILKTMKETWETKPYSCEFCKRSFLRESTVLKHICEYKHRWMDKDKQGNRLGFQSWIEFYKKNSTSKKQKTYEEFIRSAYYTAFVKFGSYCVDVNVLNVNRYIDWLLKNQIKIDSWCQDTNYTKFLIEYLRIEDPMDAIARSIETTINMASVERVLSKDYLRYGNSNKICYAITTGKLSPWILYHSASGKEFLDKLDESQIKMVIDYLNPELWAIKFKREPEKVDEVKSLLTLAGY
jgi:hypothetical protein